MLLDYNFNFSLSYKIWQARIVELFALNLGVSRGRPQDAKYAFRGRPRMHILHPEVGLGMQNMPPEADQVAGSSQMG